MTRSTTIIVLSYRYGHLVSQAVESAISQTYPVERILVIDDGVGDCRHVPELYPEVDFIERDRNFGQLDSFRDALSRVQTERYMILGADNWLRLDALEKMNNQCADIVSYDILVMGNEREKWCSEFTNAKRQDDGSFYWSRKGSHHGSMLFNTKLAKTVGYGRFYSKSGLLCEDRFLYDGMLRNGASYKHIPEGLLYYRRHLQNFNPIN